MKVATTTRPLYKIAADVRKTWKRISPHAEPYLRAMEQMNKITDSYGLDSGDSIVAYFLSNAHGWRGETAQAIKAELNGMLPK